MTIGFSTQHHLPHVSASEACEWYSFPFVVLQYVRASDSSKDCPSCRAIVCWVVLVLDMLGDPDLDLQRLFNTTRIVLRSRELLIGSHGGTCRRGHNGLYFGPIRFLTYPRVGAQKPSEA